MHPVVYYTVLFAIAGGAGMAVAAKKATPVIRRQRSLKYYMYILITGTVIASMFLHFFSWLSLAVVLIAGVELIRINIALIKVKALTVFTSIFIFLVIATGFFLFATTFDPEFLVFIYFQVLVFDGFCQVTGQLWGKRPLAVWISPAKTVEGLVGGCLCGVLAAVIAGPWVQASIPVSILFGVFTGFVASFGDMLASYYKRVAGVKDYSNLLPGQGGFMDRFDSFIMTGSTYYFLYILLFKIGAIIEHS